MGRPGLLLEACLDLWLILILNVGYGIVPTAYSLSSCRFNQYMTFLPDVLRPFYLILASADRVLITSTNALTRQRSTHRLAYIAIIIGTIFWMLFHIHALVLATIVQYGPNDVLCYYTSDAEIAFYTYYLILIKGFLLPSLLVILGLWSIKNVRRLGRGRVVPILSTAGITTVGNDTHPVHSKDRQLVLMLLIDICIYIFFCWILSGFLLYQQITKYNMKSYVQTQTELLITSVFSLVITFYRVLDVIPI